jgi:hypothetical protein
MNKIEFAHEILSESKRSTQLFLESGRDFHKVKANMYSIFECYAHGLIGWNQVRSRWHASITEYLNLYADTPDLYLSEGTRMLSDYETTLVLFGSVLREYKRVNEQKMISNIVIKGKLNESQAKEQSNVYFNRRALKESELRDTVKITSWKKVQESYPNLTPSDELRIRILTIFEGSTVDTTQLVTTYVSEEPTAISGPMQTSMRPKPRPAATSSIGAGSQTAQLPNGSVDGSTKGIDPKDNYSPADFAKLTGQPAPSLAPNTSMRPKPRPTTLTQSADNRIRQEAINIVDAIKGKVAEGYKTLPNIDTERYTEIPGLEGPFRTLSGKVVYYDPTEGAYYDRDTDMYLSYDEFTALDNDYSGMKAETVKEYDRQYVDWQDDDGPSAAAGAVISRLHAMGKMESLLQTYGLDEVEDAIANATGFWEEGDEIGSSDVSAWANNVLNYLGGVEEAKKPRSNALIRASLVDKAMKNIKKSEEPTDSKAKRGIDDKVEEEVITELTAEEKRLINTMYDKKGNLTDVGKKVRDHGKAAAKKVAEDVENTLDGKGGMWGIEAIGKRASPGQKPDYYYKSDMTEPEARKHHAALSNSGKWAKIRIWDRSYGAAPEGFKTVKTDLDEISTGKMAAYAPKAVKSRNDANSATHSADSNRRADAKKTLVKRKAGADNYNKKMWGYAKVAPTKELDEAYISNTADAVNVLANLRKIGKSIERGQQPGYEGNLANMYATDVWDVYQWIESKTKNFTAIDKNFQGAVDEMMNLRSEAKKLETTPGSGSNARFGNQIVTVLYPVMQYIERDIKN